MDKTVYEDPFVKRAIEKAHTRAAGSEETYVVWVKKDEISTIIRVFPEGEILRGGTAVYHTDMGELL